MKSEWYKIMNLVSREKGKDDDMQLRRVVTCSCKKSYPFICQRDERPEYYTFIHLQCDCGNLIRMKFPVN